MKTYLFDFDGTLVDSMPAFIAGVLKELDKNNCEYNNDVIKIITPLGLAGTADYFIQTFGLDVSKEELVANFKNNMANEYFYHIPAKRNVIKVLKQLKDSGASLNVLTASPHVTLDACLKRLQMFNLFDNVWSCDDFSTTKANPEIYKRASEKLNVNVKDVLFLDDNLNANITAKTAGMQVCGVYDESSADYVDQMKAECDFYVYDFEQLLEIK
ncbi:MAG: HAD-IA family hydrolase [Clostridia bacterium]|nr:HAD-IA family hydrolase [Clostridia bacterium]